MPDSARLECACLDAWPARVRETHRGWVHCATDGYSGRTNAVWPLAWEGGDIERAIADASAWCRAENIAPCFKLAEGTVAPADLPAALTRAGFAPSTETLVMTAPVVMRAEPSFGVELLSTPDERIWAPLQQSAPSAGDYAERVDIVSRIKAPRTFALANQNGVPAALGMGVLSDDLIGIYLMRTAPAARRQGLARAVLHGLLNWGANQGVARTYLQVEAENTTAVKLYASEGFTTAYRYHYWRSQD